MKKTTRFAILLALVGLGAGVALGSALCGACGGAGANDAAWDEMSRSVFPASVILLPIDGQTRESQVRDATERVYRELVDGGDFAAIAKRVSKDDTAQDGGFKGFAPIQGDTMFGGALQALKPGEISFPIRVKEGYQIVKRHTFEEACALEAAKSIPASGVFVRWADLPDGLPGVTREEARKLAEELVADLQAGRTTLDEAAEKYTPEAQRRRGAFLGLIPNRPESAQAFAALSKVGVGGVVGPIQEPFGYAVLVRGRHLRTLVRHILIQHLGSEGRDIRIGRTREEALEVAQKVLAEVRADRSTWDSAVERFSDDTKNLTNGGSLGAVHVAELDPAMQQALYSMAPDTIYPEVVDTPVGFHILWRVK